MVLWKDANGFSSPSPSPSLLSLHVVYLLLITQFPLGLMDLMGPRLASNSVSG